MENPQTQNWFQRVKPFAAVVSIQLGYAIMDVLSKTAMNKGMSNYVFVVYRHAVAFIVIAPLAWFFDKKVRPKMTLSIFIKIVVLSLLEPVIDQNLYFLGMKYTTATFAVTMINILPAITFIFACIFRLEKIKIRSIHSQAKVVGTLTTVSGAMVMTLLKGPVLFGSHRSNDDSQNGTSTQHTITGFIMITIGCFSWASFMILQAITLKSYPAELSLSAWICLMGTIEGAVVAMIMERGNPSVWSIKFDVRLLCAIYTGIVCSGVAYYLQGVVMQTRGPVFVTAFSPLGMVIVAIMGFYFLSEQVFLGRLIGAIIICLGLYVVVWGKSKDYSPPSPNTQEPILPAKQIMDKDNDYANENCTVNNFGNGMATQNEEV
ncbi:WAT1-related protein At2g37460 [Cajanus cajan]|uniref:WAT1-related protein n=1 Tax=Cajanus cajan TaxID=3821 RepID=A0A151R200_CAJCA|nr:WAT1-related protein At2g37460 [Cajanus cajan]KYP36543.1 Auxin-induced protein 5NG4 [Cajanus cajan]